MKGIYHDFVQFPIGSKESPFDKDAKGKYFGWLTNRKNGCSYLAESKNAFRHGDNALVHAMPMGYTNLWILERVALEINGEIVATYGKVEKNVRYIYIVLDESGKYERITEDEYIELCQDKVLSGRAVKLTANLVEDFYWH